MEPMRLDSIMSDSSRSPFLVVIASVLESLAVLPTEQEKSTPYDAVSLPTISIVDYLKRWVRHTRCSAAAVVASVILLDRLCISTGVNVTARNIHKLLLAALTVTHKWHCDTPFFNSHYARVGGVSLTELNNLERMLLSDLDFDLTVPSEDLDTYVEMFRKHKRWPVKARLPEFRNSPSWKSGKLLEEFEEEDAF
eukprot:Hpha_TRINITY_DN15235_c7_g2::TRINITY_DN15235_c7_g2_i2::g.67923::m.67923